MNRISLVLVILAGGRYKKPIVNPGGNTQNENGILVSKGGTILDVGNLSLIKKTHG